MDAHELRARTAWGLMAEPADVLAWHLHHELGAREALDMVLHPTALRGLQDRLSARTEQWRALPQKLSEYRARYSPARVRLALETQAVHEISAISPDHPWWPQGLADLGHRGPTTLWVKGSLHQAMAAQAVAIVGSSTPSRAGRQAALAVSDVALERGLALVGGGTRGIATDVHRRAVNRGGISVAVMAGGLENTYPPDNASLFARLLQRGALVSEAPCTVEPTMSRFLARNRLVAALGAGVVIVQAEYRSGAISVGYHAASIGRHVGVVPGSWHDTLSAGCWRIYRECGAIVLTDPAELSLVTPQVA
ncbi:MAG: DNA-protecting protein DprA [Pontimonas sp.]|nr:DNA-protecting protein DprA [Pontimonas sp.]